MNGQMSLGNSVINRLLHYDISEVWNFKRQACMGLLNGLVSALPPLTPFVFMQCLFHGTAFGNCWIRVSISCLHVPIQFGCL